MTELKTKEECITEFEEIRTRMDEILKNLKKNPDKVETVKAKLDDILENLEKKVGYGKEEEICNCLKSFQIYPNIKGYAYLKTAIGICIEHPEYTKEVTKKLYPEVARIYKTNTAGVIRAMRSAIKTRMPRTSKSVKNKFFMGKEEVTTSEFIFSIAEIIAKEDKEEKEETIETGLTNILKRLGIPTNIKGFQYLRTAIIMAVERPEILKSIMKEVYLKTAILHKETLRSVEHAIRYAIKNSLAKSDSDFYIEIFGHEKEKKPTNAEYISAVANYIRLNK